MSARPATDAAVRFEPWDPAFIEDPYPTLNALREAAPVFYAEPFSVSIICRMLGVPTDRSDDLL